MFLKIEVTEEDISAAEHNAGEYNKCPVARALAKLGFTQIDADEDRILLTNGNNRLVFSTAREASIFISDFDSGHLVKPICFDLGIPRDALPSDERKPLYKPSDI